MRRTVLRRMTFYAGLLALSSCLDTYDAPSDLAHVEVLVIDGFLNGTSRSAYVKISHAQSLLSNIPPRIETGAKVSIHSDDGDQFALIENPPGIYSRSNLDVEPYSKYQLRVTSAQGTDYQSDYVELRQAPPITDVSVEPNALLTGLEVMVSSKDITNATRYYRWDYLETWEYTSPFRSDFKKVGPQIIPRVEGEGIYRCYRTQPSTSIMVGTSVHLTDDVISDALLTTIPAGDPRTYVRYSVEVMQRAISRHEYDYLKQLQVSTESLGGLFDPLPSQVYGNMHNTQDNSVPVLGYFSAGSTQKFRKFYDHDELPTSMRLRPPVGACQAGYALHNDTEPMGIEMQHRTEDDEGR